MANSKANLLAFPTRTPGSDAGLAPDWEARERALDVTASWIVEAPAGSGKTGLLMQRYLKLLADPNVLLPEEVLAITFTRKATAELRERILAQLHAVVDTSTTPRSPFDTASLMLAAAVLQRDAALGWGILDRPQRLNIRTIDSVCSEIAGMLPLLSGSGAPRTPSDNADPLYRLSAQRTLLQLGGPDTKLSDAIRTVLLHRDGSLSDCETLIARMLQQREQWAELVPLGAQLEDEALEAEVRPKLESALEQIVCAGLTRAARVIPPDMLIALSWLAARLAHEPGYKGKASPIFICANKSDPPDTRAENFEHWCALISLVVTGGGDWRSGFAINHVGFALSKDDKALLKDLIDQVRHDTHLRDTLCSVRALPPVRYPDEQWAVAKSLFRLVVRALAELKVLFAERDECDFTEVSMAAKEALRSDSGVSDLSAAAGSTLRHLLVDEMQDTSSSQYELIEQLTRTWDGHSQTLFLVGDPKQSIYLFRQARVERFLRTMREGRLGDIPLAPLHLTANFRSQAELVENFNHDFSLIFPAPDEPQADSQAVDVPFIAAHPSRARTESGTVWHTTILGADETVPPKIAKQRHSLAEARGIRQAIENWRETPLPEGRTKPWRIAVLARVRSHLTHILAELDRPDADGHGIPFRAIDIESLSDRPEVLDALALTRALLHPADRVAWLAVLHGPWCGLGLADLLSLSGNGLPETAKETFPAAFASRHELLSAEGRHLFDRVWPILSAALQQRGRTSTATWVERTWRSLGGDVSLTSSEMKNVQLFLRALRKVEEPGGRVDLSALEAAVDRLCAEPRPSGDNEFVVDLSTIHKAKGLEWDVVFVPGLERASQANRSDLLNWLELDTSDASMAHVILAPIYGKGAEPDALHKWISHVRSERDAAERKRLFYVACTRAREELHLFAAATLNKAHEPTARPGTLLQAAWPAAQTHFAETSTKTAEALRLSLELEDESSFPLALAAGAENTREAPPKIYPILHRLPANFRPEARFEAAASVRLPYPQAATLPQQPTFERPEGSYAVRAFGNVVHRFLQLTADRLENSASEAVLAEFPSWLPRITAALRAEGLPPSTIEQQMPRVLQALSRALTDEVGRWILSPHANSHSEQPLRVVSSSVSELRVDRIFLAGASPLSAGTSHLWIVDFKTTEQGSRSDELFIESEKAKYAAQLASYARACATLPEPPEAVVQGLYYPMLSRLITW